MTTFTPLAATLGGALIGLSALLLLLLTGRLAGISGIFGNLLALRHGDSVWRLAFGLGLVVAPALYAGLAGSLPPFTVTSSSAALVIGGLFVGFGTRLSGGCTSGHGICGLARLSPRSIAATLTFMVTGAATVFVLRHLV
ncbi:MAG: YeeE/YedE family protein [Beijerinckiaceae bacterium]